MVGRALGQYRILEKLGEGGMGVVWKARDTHLDRFVAIKTLSAEKVADAERKGRFVQEAKAASALNHPNIVHIYDIATESIWASTGQGVCFFDLSNPARLALKFHSFAAGRATLLREFPNCTRVDTVSTALSVSPDGRWILYTQLDQDGSDLVLVENYR